MSHFTVLVIGDDIDKQLEPYAEQDFKPEYGEFENLEEQYQKEFNEGTIEVVVESDGKVYFRYDSRFRKSGKNFNENYEYPKDAVLKSIAFKDFYEDFEHFLKDYHGTDCQDEITGQYGYWSNPNAKWDWYVVGGRWSGFFKPKEGKAGLLGHSGSFGNLPRDGWVDQIKYGDVDFEAMKQHEEKIANEHFDQIESIVNGRVIPNWKEIREKHGDNIDLAREEYNSNPVISDFNKAGLYHFNVEPSEEYGNGRDHYVTKCKNGVAVPYAIVKDGVWYQKGEMGWFGMSSNEMSQDEWNNEFWKLMDSLEPDTQLTLVDCHI